METAPARSWVRHAEVDASRGPAGALTTGEREELAARAALGWLKAVYVSRSTRPATARTLRGDASQMAIAESALQPIAIQKASV